MAYVIESISIPSFQKRPGVGPSSKSYTVYYVVTDIKDKGTVSAYRRYKFYELHLQMTRKGGLELDSELPSKKLVGNLVKDFVEKRRQGLEKYLKGICAHSGVLSNKSFKLFINYETGPLTGFVKSSKDLRKLTKEDEIRNGFKALVWDKVYQTLRHRKIHLMSEKETVFVELESEPVEEQWNVSIRLDAYHKRLYLHRFQGRPTHWEANKLSSGTELTEGFVDFMKEEDGLVSTLQTVEWSNIAGVQTGEEVDPAKRKHVRVNEQFCFSILFRTPIAGKASIDCQARNMDTFLLWTEGLRLIIGFKNLHPHTKNELNSLLEIEVELKLLSTTQGSPPELPPPPPNFDFVGVKPILSKAEGEE